MTEKEKLITHMLELLENPHKELNPWELDFVESVREQFEIRKTLSERQFEILEHIYVEKTA